MHEVRITRLLGLQWDLIAAIDSGKFTALTLETIYQHAETETLQHVFLSTLKEHSFCSSALDENDWKTLNNEWMNMHNAIDARRKFGVENQGLCLLLAYVTQSLQQRVTS